MHRPGVIYLAQSPMYIRLNGVDWPVALYLELVLYCLSSIAIYPLQYQTQPYCMRRLLALHTTTCKGAVSLFIIPNKPSHDMFI